MVENKTAYAVVCQSGYPSALSAVAANHVSAFRFKQTVLRTYPETTLAVANHTVVLVGVLPDGFRRGERRNGVGLCVEQKRAILCINGNPRFFNGACADNVAVVVQLRKLAVEHNGAVVLRIEIGQLVEALAL